MAEEAAWLAQFRPPAGRLRQLSPEPRPDRQLGPRAALPCLEQSRTLQGDDRASAAGTGHADALPRTGVCSLNAVSIFCRLFAGDGRRGAGRTQIKFLSQFPSIASPEMIAQLPDPADPQTFQRCKLDFSERTRHAEAYALHRDLLRLRREDPVFHRQEIGAVDGAVLGPEASCSASLAARATTDSCSSISAPIFCSVRPQSRSWLRRRAKFGRRFGRSEDPRYGGHGTPPLYAEGNWRIVGQATVVLASENCAAGDP